MGAIFDAGGEVGDAYLYFRLGTRLDGSHHRAHFVRIDPVGAIFCGQARGTRVWTADAEDAEAIREDMADLH